MHKNGTQNLWRREMRTDSRFAAATGRVRVLEERMLAAEDFRQLADPRVSFSQRRDILTRAGYTGEGSNEELILSGRDEQDRLLYELSKGSDLAVILLLDLDYHNVKAIVRYLLLEQHEQRDAAARAQTQTENLVKEQRENIPRNLKPLMRETAPTPPETVFDLLVDLMLEDGVASPPPDVRPVFFENMKKIVKVSGTGKELASADLLADRLCFEEMLLLTEQPEQSGIRDFLLDYISILADAANLETFLRIRRGHGSKSFLEEALVPGGKVSEEELLDLYGKDQEALNRAFKKSYISDVMDPLPQYRTREDIQKFGSMKDELLLKVAVLGKRATASGEAVLGYWLAKRLEMRNVRLILQAVSRGMRAEEILPLIRTAYKGYSL